MMIKIIYRNTKWGEKPRKKKKKEKGPMPLTPRGLVKKEKRRGTMAPQPANIELI